MTTQFKLFIDTDDDGFVNEEFTQYVHTMEWSLGFPDEYTAVAPLSWATIIMDDVSGLVADDFYNHQVNIVGVNDTTTEILWSGWGRSVSNVGMERETMTLNCVGFEEPLFSQRVSIPIQIDQKAGAILALVIEQVNFRSKVLADVLVLDDSVTGFLGSLLGAIRYPPASDTLVLDDPVTGFLGFNLGFADSLDEGTHVFPYAGDRWDNMLAIDIINDIVTSDGGRFYVGRDGRFVYKDRSSLVESIRHENTLSSGSIVDYEVVTGAQLFNASQVTFAGRFVGTPDSVIFLIDQPIKVRPGVSRTIKCRFRDANDNASGAIDVNNLFEYINYFGNSEPDGSGIDYTQFLSLDQIAKDGNSVTFEIYHQQVFDVWIYVLFITGTPVSKSDPMTVEIVNAADATMDGYRYISSSAPLISTSQIAESLAAGALARFTESTNTVTFVLCDVDVDDLVIVRSILDGVNTSDLLPYNAMIFGEHHNVSSVDKNFFRFNTGYSWDRFMVYPFRLDGLDYRRFLA